MTITEAEYKQTSGKSLAMVSHQDFFVEKNGESAAKLTRPVIDKAAVLDSLAGIIPAGTETDVREARLSRQ